MNIDEMKNLEDELDKLKDPYNQEGLSEVDTKKISKTQEEIDEKLRNIYENLDPWQIALVANASCYLFRRISSQ